MTFTKEQQKTAYKKLSPEVQNFIMDNETTELIANYLKESGLSEEQSNLADSEILYAMYGLQTLSDAINNIAKLSNKTLNDLSKLKTDLENNIFSKIQTPNAGGVRTFSKEKVVEISKKYSLSESQTEKLLNIAGLVAREPVETKVLLETITDELAISGLLAEQLVNDLQSRVLGKTDTKAVESKPVSIGVTPKTPEVRPEITPLNIPAEMRKPTMQNDMLDKQKTFGSSPIGVPRYAEGSVKVNTVTSTQNISAGNIIENKLNNVTPSIKEGIKEIPTKYEKDPYREAL